MRKMRLAERYPALDMERNEFEIRWKAGRTFSLSVAVASFRSVYTLVDNMLCGTGVKCYVLTRTPNTRPPELWMEIHTDNLLVLIYPRSIQLFNPYILNDEPNYQGKQ